MLDMDMQSGGLEVAEEEATPVGVGEEEAVPVGAGAKGNEE